MLNSKPYIILVRPQLPENIGMVARAMDNCGLKNLILVSPREKWPNKKSLSSSANSKHIIEKTKVYKTMVEATSKFNYVVATSSRKRFLQKPYFDNFNNLNNKLQIQNKIAFVFGPENSGLSNEDLMLCDAIYNIQLSNTNKSLNLSHAVLLFSYKYMEMNNKNNNSLIKNKKKNNLSLKKDFNLLMNYLKNELEEVRFLFPKHKSKSMFNNIQTMFLRSELSKNEIQTLWGMIKKLRNSKKK